MNPEKPTTGDGDISGLACPLPYSDYQRVVLAHGGGGRVMNKLITELFLRHFSGPKDARGHDGAVFSATGRLAITTDGFTVSPLFFPGGDIGSLAVCGTVNDLAMCGARPRYLSAGFILEEGLRLVELERIVRSMAETARVAGVTIVTGDTKVVERGKGDGVYITTTGIGTVDCPQPVHPDRVRAGDAILVSGPLGDHGIAVMAARERLSFTEPLLSDVAPVAEPVAALFDAGIDVRCLRDPTRGGLVSALTEIAGQAGLGARIRDGQVPVRPQVRDCCELLGLDPFYVACEGRFVAVVEPQHVERALATLRTAGCPDAAHIGEFTVEPIGVLTLHSPFGPVRILDMLSGEQLPRIC